MRDARLDRRDDGVPRLEHAAVHLLLLRGEPARDRPGAGDVRGVVLEVGAVIHVDQLAGPHLPRVVHVVDDRRERPRGHDRRERVARAPMRVFTYCAAAAISYSYIPGRVARIASATAAAPMSPAPAEPCDFVRRLDPAQLVELRAHVGRVRCGTAEWIRSMASEAAARGRAPGGPCRGVGGAGLAARWSRSSGGVSCT